MTTINGRACVANGRNLIVQSGLKKGYLVRDNGGVNVYRGNNFYSDNYIATNGETVFTFSSPDYVFKGSTNHTLAMYDSDKNYLGYQTMTSATQTLSKSNVAYIRFSINFSDEGCTTGNLSDWLNSHRYKLETGTTATPWTPAPVDKVFSNGRQVYGRNLLLDTDFWITQPNTSQPLKWAINQDDLIGETITISFRVDIDNVTAIANQKRLVLAFSWVSHSDNTIYVDPSLWVDEIGVSIHQIVAKTIVIQKDAKLITLTPRIYNQGVEADSIKVGHPKIEKGTKATDWTPAPEDVI